jgi:uncharacterized protein YecE (DUF72 family)
LFTATGEAPEVQPAAWSGAGASGAATGLPALPGGLYLGTSSWSFPGWQGLVYGGRYSGAMLARHGLAAYAQHPGMNSVGVDRSFYAALAAPEYRHYAGQVPASFRFLVKGHVACTGPPGKPGEPDRFLNADYAARAVVEPALEGLGDKLGVLLWQFPPLPPGLCAEPQAFIGRLHRFLAELPRGVRHAVELRDASVLSPEYADALADAEVAHCLNLHPRMPSPREQIAALGRDVYRTLVIRWMLNRRHGYEQARERYRPFNRLIDVDHEARNQILRLCRRALAAGRAAFVIANNKAEGSAPLSLSALAEMMSAPGGAAATHAAGVPGRPG